MTAATRSHAPRVGFSDLVSEATAGLLARPGRAALTVLGTVLGIAALVATLGVSKTAGNQIVGKFDALAATDVVVAPRPAGTANAPAVLTWDASDRIRRLNGVVAAGTLSNVDLRGELVRSVPINDPLGQTSFRLPVKAASPGLYEAVRATLRTGRLPDRGHSDRADRVVVLGRLAADRLNITRVDQQPAIFLGDHLYLVTGILDSVRRQPDLLNAAIIPEGTARRDFALRAPGSVQIETQIGAASLIARQAPIALSPNDPAVLRVTAPPEPRRLRGSVQQDLNTLFLVLGLVSLLVGAIGIANVTLVSVLERTGEIGLRRALGARRRHIASQFLAESTTIGFLGGVLGASFGVLVVVIVAAFRTWTPVLDSWIPLAAPVAGAIIGLASGVYPSLRAARLEPVDALRAGT
jgi:hypothetical protein